MTLLDLDAELIRIRDLRSRVYFGDALRSYRVGAFRAAISSAWVALVYDLLRKNIGNWLDSVMRKRTRS